jgi:carboxyl-terminal processing protease
VRALRTALLVALLVLAFVGAYAIVAHLQGDTVPGLSGAVKAGLSPLQQEVIGDLQRYYYRPVDPQSLARAGVKAEQKSINAMLKTLNDPYTEYLSPDETRLFTENTKGTYSGVGAVLQKKDGRLEVTSVIQGSPAAEAKIRPGDVIVSVDGKPTADEAIDVSISRIKGKPGTTVHLTIRRKGVAGLIQLTLTRREIAFPLTRSRLIDDHGIKVGYVQLYEFSSGAADKVRQAVDSLTQQGATWFILDLRYNGGGLLEEGVGVASDFLSGDRVVVTTSGLHSPKEVFRATGNPATTRPMVVLVNHWTASASEIVTGALQDYHRATVIGTTTYGKGLVQNVLSLPGGASLKLTTAVYLTPNGANINHEGIHPSIVVSDNPKTKRDEVLQRALRFIATGH